MWHAPEVVVECVRNKEACVFAAGAFRPASCDPCFGLLPAPVIRGERHRLPPLDVDEWIAKKEFFDAGDEASRLNDPEPNTNE